MINYKLALSIHSASSLPVSNCSRHAAIQLRADGYAMPVRNTVSTEKARASRHSEVGYGGRSIGGYRLEVLDSLPLAFASCGVRRSHRWDVRPALKCGWCISIPLSARSSTFSSPAKPMRLGIRRRVTDRERASSQWSKLDRSVVELSAIAAATAWESIWNGSDGG